MNAHSSVNARVGDNIRAVRLNRGVSLSELASAIGASVDELEKCERGEKRLSAKHLLYVARHLQAPYSTIFSGASSTGPDFRASLRDLIRPRRVN